MSNDSQGSIEDALRAMTTTEGQVADMRAEALRLERVNARLRKQILVAVTEYTGLRDGTFTCDGNTWFYDIRFDILSIRAKIPILGGLPIALGGGTEALVEPF